MKVHEISRYDLQALYTLQCDRCAKYVESTSDSEREVAKEFNQQGWKKVGEEILCPNCMKSVGPDF